MTENNVTKDSKAQTIKAPPPEFNNRYEAIDVVEEGNCKAQSQLKKTIYMNHTLILKQKLTGKIKVTSTCQRPI